MHAVVYVPTVIVRGGTGLAGGCLLAKGGEIT